MKWWILLVNACTSKVYLECNMECKGWEEWLYSQWMSKMKRNVFVEIMWKFEGVRANIEFVRRKIMCKKEKKNFKVKWSARDREKGYVKRELAEWNVI